MCGGQISVAFPLTAVTMGWTAHDEATVSALALWLVPANLIIAGASNVMPLADSASPSNLE